MGIYLCIHKYIYIERERERERAGERERGGERGGERGRVGERERESESEVAARLGFYANPGGQVEAGEGGRGGSLEHNTESVPPPSPPPLQA